MPRWTPSLLVAGLALLAPLLAAAPASAAPSAVQTPIRVAAADVSVWGPVDTPVYPSCQADLPPYSDCGFAQVDLTLRGFDAYGGISDCTSGEDTGCPAVEFGSVGTTGSARLHAAVTCGVDPREHVVQATLPVRSVSRYFQSSVNSYTRTSSDSAVVTAWFEFPRPAAYRVCGNAPVTVVRAKVFSVRIGFEGAGGVADAQFAVPGIHRFDS